MHAEYEPTYAATRAMIIEYYWLDLRRYPHTILLQNSEGPCLFGEPSKHPISVECRWGLFESRSLIKVSCLHLSRKDWLSGRTLTRRGFPHTYASWDPYQRGDNQSSMIGIAEEKCYHSATFLQYDPSDGCELERFWVGRVHARTRSGIPRLVF